MEDTDEQILLAVEGKIRLVSASDIQSSSEALDGQKMAAKETITISSAPTNRSNYIAVGQSCSYQRQSISKYLLLPRKGEYDREREKSNEQAFQSWLRKKSELQRLHSQQQTLTNEESLSREEKRYQNERAFAAWLEKKKAQKEIMKSSDSTLTTQQIKLADNLRHSFSYEEWKRKKEKEREIQLQFDNYKTKEVQETTKYLDPDLANKAYKRSDIIILLLLIRCHSILHIQCMF